MEGEEEQTLVALPAPPSPGGGIPDANVVFLARKKREAAREAGYTAPTLTPYKFSGFEISVIYEILVILKSQIFQTPKTKFHPTH